MPELPEVHTTVTILNTLISGKKIESAWSNYDSPHYVGKENIKDVLYFSYFKKQISGKDITSVYRRGKNILINLSGDTVSRSSLTHKKLGDNPTILIHMKMTGHLLFGKYSYTKKENVWLAQDEGPLQDPFNQFIHFTLSFFDGTTLAFSDMRKFATVKLLKDEGAVQHELKKLGPEPLDPTYDWQSFKENLLCRPRQKIKTALMDQSLIVGIGNIYSDEMLWSSSIHPERTVASLSDIDFKNLLRNGKKVLEKGIDFGGDSMSDYRNPYGLPGDFQKKHNAYRRTGESCKKRGCDGTMLRKVVGGRSAHFCSKHQTP